VRVLRDPYSAKPWVLFYATKRGGGGVQDFDAIKSANDPAKTLEELQEPIGRYHDHHIAKEAAARDAGDPESLIQGRDNRVRIPVLKHIEITRYYSTKVEQEDGTRISPRDRLKGTDFETRREFGLGILRKYGVLK
jgi:hypothetical protein